MSFVNSPIVKEFEKGNLPVFEVEIKINSETLFELLAGIGIVGLILLIIAIVLHKKLG